MRKFWAEQFRRPAGFGGRISTFLMNVLNKPMYKTVERLIRQDSSILDIGFGNGYALKRLLKLSNSVFYGIDVSPDMSRVAAAKNKKAVAEGRLQLAEGSISDIPFDKVQFDQIYSINTVYFWDDLSAGLGQVYDRLSPGGEFLNICYTKQWLERRGITKFGFLKYAESELLAATLKAGFSAEIVYIKQGKSFYIKAVK